MESLVELLVAHPFCQGLSREVLALVAGCASQKIFQAGDLLFREGDTAADFYLIRHGSVAMELFRARKGGITMQTRGDGDILGWLGLAPPYSWNYDARALSVTRTIVLDVQAMYELCEAHREVGYELLKRFVAFVARHSRMMKLQLVDIYG